MRAVVTGAAGFIGSILTERLLDEGWKVLGVDRLSDYYSVELKRQNLSKAFQHPSFTFLQLDLSAQEPDFLKDGDVVFHLAAQPGVRKSWGKEFEIYAKDNLLATQRLLEKCKELKIKKFIYASSSSVYGSIEQLPLKEDMRPQPFSPYGVTKLAAENLALLYHRNFGIPTVSLRFFTVVGRRQRPDMAFHRFLKALYLNQEIVIFGDGSQSRDFTHVDNIIEGIMLALERGKDGEVYNLGAGRNIKLLDAVKLMEQITGRRAKLKFVEKAKGDVYHTLADLTKAREQLGYEPKKSLEEGIEEEWNWICQIYS